MKKIGLIGGMGPESTLDYYKELINVFKDESSHLDYPEIIIYSINLSEFIGLMKRRQNDKIIDLLSQKLQSLKDAGADFAAITANTPHLFFDQLKERAPFPLISIVEATCDEAFRRGLKRSGLIGTGFTMDSSFYSDVFKRRGMEIIVPESEDQKRLNHLLFTEIELGIFKDETRKEMIQMTEKMVREDHIDSLILGCTEFPLILSEKEYAGIPMLNTTKIHVNAIAAYAKE